MNIKLNTSILLFVLCFSLFQTHALNITQQQALDAVTAYRQLSTDPGRYYITTVDTVLNDRFHCTIDTMPPLGWLNSGSPLWMVFVDEQPTNHLWSHPCNYYYVPTVTTSSDNIPVVGFSGRWKHSGLGLVPAIEPTPTGNPALMSPIAPPIDTLHAIARTIPNKLHVVMLVGGSETDNNFMAFYRDAKYFYRVLTQKYGVPKQNIHVLMGSGGEEVDDAKDYNSTIGSEEIVTMPTDLDDDGLADVACSTRPYDVDSVFCRLAAQLDSTEHFMMFVDAHGEPNPSRISLWGLDFYYQNEGLYASLLRTYLDNIHSATQCIILGNCFAGNFVRELKSEGRIIVAASDTTSAWGNEVFGYFIHSFTNALNGTDCLDNFVASDSTEDCVVSMYEAYMFAANYQNFEHESIPSFARVGTKFSSIPPSLAEDWSLGYQPSPAELYVRDCVSDKGEEATFCYWSSEWRPWESPDIWVRNSDDGLTNWQSEPLMVTSTDNTVYVYVRLTNRGFKPYPGHGRYMHLHWAKPSLNHWSGSWQPSLPGDPMLPEIAILPVTTVIDTAQSTIVSYAWTVPQALVSEAVNNHDGHLWVDLLARVSDSPHKTIYDHNALLLPYRYADVASVLQSRAMAQSSVYANNSNESVAVPVTLQNIGDEPRTFSISPQSFPSGAQPACLNLSITLPAALARLVHGDSTITQADTVAFSGIGPFTLPAHSSYTLMLNGTVNSALAQSHSVYSKALDVYSSGQLVGGATIVMTTDPRQSPLVPGIDDSEPGGEEGGEIELGDGGNGAGAPRLLRMTGIDEPVSCRWSDAAGNLLGTDQTLAVSRRAEGTYTLTVTALSDGAIASVSKDLSPMAAIQSAVADGDNLTLTLFHAAQADMQVAVQPSLEMQPAVRAILPCGSMQCVISLSTLPQGPWAVSLWQNGQLLDSVQVMR